MAWRVPRTLRRPAARPASCQRIFRATWRPPRAASSFACTRPDPARDGVDDFKGGIDELHQRFREKEVEIFENHGAEIIAVWQNLDDPNTLIWMLAYRDRAHRQEVWAAFAADPEWTALRQKYNVPIGRPNVFMMSATDYSALK